VRDAWIVFTGLCLIVEIAKNVQIENQRILHNVKILFIPNDGCSYERIYVHTEDFLTTV